MTAWIIDANGLLWCKIEGRAYPVTRNPVLVAAARRLMA